MDSITVRTHHHIFLLAAASLFLVLVMLAKATAIDVFNEFGTVKYSWPELRGLDGLQAQAKLTASKELGKGNSAYIHRPSGEPVDYSGAGTNQDVWIYTDDYNRVYDTPKRGPWHPNRISPGWPELVVKPYKVAIEQILEEVQGLKVVYGPAGFLRSQDFRADRVYLDVDDQELVAEMPRIG